MIRAPVSSLGRMEMMLPFGSFALYKSIASIGNLQVVP